MSDACGGSLASGLVATQTSDRGREEAADPEGPAARELVARVA